MSDLISGKYRIIEKIADGGMGTVYKALQLDLERTVALKKLSPVLAEEPHFKKRFRQEALVIARLSHPNIVNVIGIEQQENTCYIVMEYLEGEPLSGIIAREGPMNPKRALEIVKKVAEALHYAHSKGIIHRDIKPDNIMLLEENEVKVTDFGLARWSESSLQTEPGFSMGTPKFMSPEQARSREIDARSDIYSLGLVLFYLVTGRFAFDADNLVEIALLQEEPLPRPSEFLPDIHPEIEAFILKATRKDPADRFQTAKDMAGKLEKILEQISEALIGKATSPVLPSSQTDTPTEIKRDERFEIQAPAGEGASSGKHKRRTPFLLPGVVILLLIALGLGIAMRNRSVPGGRDGVDPIPAKTPLATPSPAITQTPVLDARYFYKLAVSLQKEGASPKEVRGNFERALDLDRNFYEALRDYGFFLFEKKDLIRAGAFLKKALELCSSPEDERKIQGILARIHEETNR